jgi:hypothetical protein
MKFSIKGARLGVLLVSALALATPAVAQVRPTTLSDASQPGSVLVFPKQLQGTVTLPEGGTAPATELEIGVVCPKGVTCSEHQAVKLRAYWVCGTTEAFAATSFVCPETDFEITATVWEKVVLTSNGEPAGAYGPGVPTVSVPAAHCPLGGEGAGALKLWFVIPTDDRPIKFDGLIGDAIRTSGTAQASYNAIPIQADPALANGAVVTTTSNGGLIFDGAPGHYQALTGQVIGDVRYTGTVGGVTAAGSLTLMTLDVHSNRPNNPVFVDLDFFGGNPSNIGNENQLSAFTEFICWEEIPITSISPDLTTGVMGRKGVVVSATATKVGIFGITDDTGPVTLLGLSETQENGGARVSFSRLFNSSVPVASVETPTPSPNFLP